MEKTEFKTKVEQLAQAFIDRVSAITPSKVNLQIVPESRCKNRAILTLSVNNGSRYEFEVWEPHSGGVYWDKKLTGFSSVFV